MSPIRVIFMGTAPLAAVSLAALAQQIDALGIVAVVTQPDRPKGRDLKPQASAVKELAIKLGLPVLQPPKARDTVFVEQLRALTPDLIVVAAYGQILPAAILDLPPHRCINVHASLLPKYRGAAPIQWAILNGDAETGVTIMLMEPTLDTGPILTHRSLVIAPEETAPSLHDRLAKAGADLLVETIPDYVSGRITPRVQLADGASYARKIIKEDGLIDWSLPASGLLNRVRGLTPWPGTYTHFEVSQKTALLKVWEARAETGSGGRPGEILKANREGLVIQCGDGTLRLVVVQREGGRRLPVGEFLAGHPLHPGQFLGAGPTEG